MNSLTYEQAMQERAQLKEALEEAQRDFRRKETALKK